MIFNSLRSIFIFSLILVVISCQNNNTDVPITNNLNDLEYRVDSVANQFLNSNKVLGFSIAVYSSKEKIYNKSFGYTDSIKTKPVTNDTGFPIASATKPIMALIAVKMMTENLIDLDDKIVAYFPDFPKSKYSNQITIRHLLNHTSGVPDYTSYVDSLYLSGKKRIILKDYFDAIENQNQLFEPGKMFSYSNSGFVIVTEILKQVSGLSYSELIEKYIKTDLSFPTIDWYYNEMKDSKTSEIFELLDSVYVKSFLNEMTYIEGDGGISSSANDLAKFIYSVNNGLIISKEKLNEMIQPSLLTSNVYSDYGLGFRTGYLEGHKVYGHTGGHITRWCVMSHFPDDHISIAVVVNTYRTPSNALDIFGAVAVECLDITLIELKDHNNPIENIESFIGDYFRPTDSKTNFMQIVKYPDDKHLYRKRSNSDSRGERLFHVGENAFAPESAPMDRLIFETNEKGDVLYFKEYYNGLFIGLRNKKN